ncbi:MAG: hypothetical protein JNJ73_09370 [Hyphomonadaceae bacterium]|nr:hypothetical protein [Hyphomonadaceae bacterium]
MNTLRRSSIRTLIRDRATFEAYLRRSETEPSFEEMRVRAYELADSGLLARWEGVALALETEGYSRARTKIGADPIFRQMLNARCEQARTREG